MDEKIFNFSIARQSVCKKAQNGESDECKVVL